MNSIHCTAAIGSFLLKCDALSLILVPSVFDTEITPLVQMLEDDLELLFYIMTNYHLFGLLFLRSCLSGPIVGDENITHGMFYLLPLARELASVPENEEQLVQIASLIRDPEMNNDNLPELPSSPLEMLSDRAWAKYCGFFYLCHKGLLEGHLYSTMAAPEVRLVKRIATKVIAGLPDFPLMKELGPEDKIKIEKEEEDFWSQYPLEHDAASWFSTEWLPQETLITPNGDQTPGQTQRQKLRSSKLWNELNPSCFLKQTCCVALQKSLDQKVKICDCPWPRLSDIGIWEKPEKQIRSDKSNPTHWLKTESGNDYYSYGTAYMITILILTVILILFLIIGTFFTSSKVYRKYTVTVAPDDVQKTQGGKLYISNPETKSKIPSNSILYSLA
jgi:hypothetical protein